MNEWMNNSSLGHTINQRKLTHMFGHKTADTHWMYTFWLQTSSVELRITMPEVE